MVNAPASYNQESRRSRVQISSEALSNEKDKKLRLERIKMEITISMETKDYPKVREIMLKDDIASRASLTFKEGKIINKEGYLCYASGTEDQCKRILELVKMKDEKGEIIELAKELTDKDKEELINKIKEEEDKAIEGFGNILG